MLAPAYETKIFCAWLELVVASRTDLALRSSVRQVSESYSKRVLEIWKQLFGSPVDELSPFRMLDRIVNGLFAVIALGRIINGSKKDDRKRSRRLSRSSRRSEFRCSRRPNDHEGRHEENEACSPRASRHWDFYDGSQRRRGDVGHGRKTTSNRHTSSTTRKEKSDEITVTSMSSDPRQKKPIKVTIKGEK